MAWHGDSTKWDTTNRSTLQMRASGDLPGRCAHVLAHVSRIGFPPFAMTTSHDRARARVLGRRELALGGGGDGANLGLGCGNPLSFAALAPGEKVRVKQPRASARVRARGGSGSLSLVVWGGSFRSRPTPDAPRRRHSSRRPSENGVRDPSSVDADAPPPPPLRARWCDSRCRGHERRKREGSEKETKPPRVVTRAARCLPPQHPPSSSSSSSPSSSSFRGLRPRLGRGLRLPACGPRRRPGRPRGRCRHDP